MNGLSGPNPVLPLLGVSALFYFSLASFFYLAALGIVGAYRRMAGPHVPQSRVKRIAFVALLLPPVAALLPTVAGMILRHMHGPESVAMATVDTQPVHSEGVMAHHAMACALIFERAAAMASFGSTGPSASLVLGGGAWILFVAGVVGAVRLAVATYRLEVGLAAFLTPPSRRLADSLGRVGERLQITPALRRRFFECALPPERSSVMGLSQAKCVLSREFVAEAPPGELDALVAHEAGHLKSGDVYAAFAVGVVNCLFFFLRPVRALGRWWRESAELAADDIAVRGAGNDPVAVASAIFRVRGAAVAGASAPVLPLPAPLLPFADESAMSAESRINRLLDRAERTGGNVRPETPAQVALSWAMTGLFAMVGAGLLLSSEAACVAHCALELLKNVR